MASELKLYLFSCFNTIRHYGPDFNNSLHQCKVSFGVKLVLSGFTKAQWRITTENEWTQLFFVPDLIEYAFVGVSLSAAKFMGEECAHQSTGICAII